MDVDEFGADGKRVQWRLRNDLIEAVVVLQQLFESLLQNVGATFEVRERFHDVGVHVVDRLLPTRIETPHQRGHLVRFFLEFVGLPLKIEVGSYFFNEGLIL